MRTLARQADGVLRGTPGLPLRRLAVIVALAGGFYGVAMGSYAGGGAVRPAQMAVSATKVPLLLTAAFAIALPSFYVLNALLGTAREFREALRCLLSAQAAVALVLTSAAPLTLFAYVCGIAYVPALLFNGVMFAIAAAAGNAVLARGYRPLIAINPRHRVMLRIWLVMYCFVGIQMGWVLRPFVGSPELPVQFFRPDGWGNAYIAVGRMVLDTLARLWR